LVAVTNFGDGKPRAFEITVGEVIAAHPPRVAETSLRERLHGSERIRAKLEPALHAVHDELARGRELRSRTAGGRGHRFHVLTEKISMLVRVLCAQREKRPIHGRLERRIAGGAAIEHEHGRSRFDERLRRLHAGETGADDDETVAQDTLAHPFLLPPTKHKTASGVPMS